LRNVRCNSTSSVLPWSAGICNSTRLYLKRFAAC
jgi:hypothetical protein